jgi:hypothetical protein
MRRAQIARPRSVPAPARKLKHPQLRQPTRPAERLTKRAQRALKLLEMKGGVIAMLFVLFMIAVVLHICGVREADKLASTSLAALLCALRWNLRRPR